MAWHANSTSINCISHSTVARERSIARWAGVYRGGRWWYRVVEDLEGPELEPEPEEEEEEEEGEG